MRTHCHFIRIKWLANRNPNRAINPRFEFFYEQSHTQRIMQMARELEQTACMTLKIKWDDNDVLFL